MLTDRDDGSMLLGGGQDVEIRAAARAASGALYFGGAFYRLINPDASDTFADNIARWDPTLGAGYGGWRAMAIGVNARVHALGVDPQERLYAGGEFTGGGGTGPGFVASRGVIRWDPALAQWQALGRGVSFVEGAEDNGRVSVITRDGLGRIVVAGRFLEAVQPNGARLRANGIARWDDANDRWVALGTGLQYGSPSDDFFLVARSVVAGGGDTLYVSGVESAEPETSGIVRWDGTQWAWFGDGHTGRAEEMLRDDTGTLYLRTSSYTTPPLSRVRWRRPGSAAWETVPLHNAQRGLAGIASAPNGVGVLAYGDFTHMGIVRTGGRAWWDGTRWQPAHEAGACARAQIINAAPEGDFTYDLHLDGTRVAEGFTTGGATPLTSMQAGHRHTLHVTPPGTDTSQARFALRVEADEGVCVSADVGVAEPDDYAPNPDGRWTGIKIARHRLPDDLRVGGTPLLFLHAVTDAPALTATLRQTGQVIAENLPYGRFAPPAALTPGAYTLDLTRAADGAPFATYALTVTDAEVTTLALRGFVDPAANQNGPPMTLTRIDDTGTATQIPTAAAPPPGGPPRARLLGHFPSPASGRATIRFLLPAPTRVRLAVYDLLGREVAVLAEGLRAAGLHAVAVEGGALAPGRYLYRLTADDGADHTRTLTLAR